MAIGAQMAPAPVESGIGLVISMTSFLLLSAPYLPNPNCHQQPQSAYNPHPTQVPQPLQVTSLLRDWWAVREACDVGTIRHEAQP